MKIKQWTATFKNLVIGNGKVKSWYSVDGNTIRIELEFTPGETSEIVGEPMLFLPPEIVKLVRR